MCTASYDCGTVGDHKFDTRQLAYGFQGMNGQM
jgi:hypothetical protein